MDEIVVGAEDVALPQDEDDDQMEDGEVGGVGRAVGEERTATGRKRIEITIKNNSDPESANNGALPDLLQEIGGGGGGSVGAGEPVRATAERLEARAKRFNIQSRDSATSGTSYYDEIIRLYQSIGIPSSEYEGVVNPEERLHRLEAIHMRGFDGRGLTSEDIYHYFKDLDFAPVSMEWVDNNSCNVIWALATSSARAMLSLSRPIHVPEEALKEAAEKAASASQDKSLAKDKSVVDGQGEPMEEDDEDMVLVQKAEEFNSDKENEDEEGEVIDKDNVMEARMSTDEKVRVKILERFGEPGDQPIPITDLGGTINFHTDYSKWRLGRPSPKLGNKLFMRIATRTDTQRSEPGSMDNRSPGKKDRILKNAGGLLSSSRKRKIQEQALAARSAAHEYEETSKRYSGGLGKNPWGGIAQEWSKNTAGHKDFADELGELASLVQGKRSVDAGKSARRGDGGITVSSRMGKGREVNAPLTDWDAPEYNEAAIGGGPKTIDVDAPEEGEATDQESDSDEEFMNWKAKLKKPKMSMHADEEQAKKSARARVGAGGGTEGSRKRKSSGGPGEEAPPVRVRRKSGEAVGLASRALNSIKGKVAKTSDLRARRPGTGLSDKLKSRLGNGAAVTVQRRRHDSSDEEGGPPGDRRRIRRREPSRETHSPPTQRTFEFHERRINRRRSESFEDSDGRDPLEKEDDLSREFRESGGQLPNMLIQVTRSPEREGKEGDGHMEENSTGRREASEDEMEHDGQPALQSMVTKIKTEKGEEERKAKARRERDRQAKANESAEREAERRRRHSEKEREEERERREREERRAKERQQQIESERKEKEARQAAAAATTARREERARREKEEKQRRADRQAEKERETRTEARDDRDRNVRSGRDRGGDRPSRDESSRGSKSATGSRSQPSSKSAPPIRIKKEKTSDDERRKKKKRDASSDSDSSSGSSSDSDSDSSSSSSDSDSGSSGSSSDSSGSGSSSDSDSSSGSDSSAGRAGKKRSSAAARNKKKTPVPSKSRRDGGGSGSTSKKRPSTSTSKSGGGRPSSSSKPGTSSSSKTKPSSSSLASKSKSSDGKRSGKSGASGSGKDLNDKLQDYLKKAKERQKKSSSDKKK